MDCGGEKDARGQSGPELRGLLRHMMAISRLQRMLPSHHAHGGGLLRHGPMWHACMRGSYRDGPPPTHGSPLPLETGAPAILRALISQPCIPQSTAHLGVHRWRPWHLWGPGVARKRACSTDLSTDVSTELLTLEKRHGSGFPTIQHTGQ